MLMLSSTNDLNDFLLSLIFVKTGLGGECVSGNGLVHATILPFAT